MFLKYLSLFSSFNFFMLAIVSRVKKTPNKKSNNILSILLLFMAVYSGFIFVHYSTLISQAYSYLRYYAPIDGIFLLLMGPCLYYYVSSVLGKSVRFNLRSSVHLIP